jgi:hypothetical protein
MRLPLLVIVLATLCAGACATYQEDLNRAQRLYHENEYERALAIFRVLDEDSDSLSRNDQARYAYLRGMTDYRLGFRPDARHWLAIAKATEQEHPGGLSPDWKQRMEEALTDLNRDVFGGAEVGSDSVSTGAERPLQADAAPPPAVPAAGTCQSSTECPTGQACQGGLCVRM